MFEWNSKDYNQFIKGSIEYGKDNINEIPNNMNNKTLTEVREYHKILN